MVCTMLTVTRAHLLTRMLGLRISNNVNTSVTVGSVRDKLCPHRLKNTQSFKSFCLLGDRHVEYLLRRQSKLNSIDKVHTLKPMNPVLVPVYCQHYASCAKFSLKNEVFLEYISSLEQEYAELAKIKNSGSKVNVETIHRIEELQPTAILVKELKIKYDELEELNKLMLEEEMKSIASEEKEKCLNEIEEKEEKLIDLLLPREKLDDNDIVLELESGAGGQESMLFLQEMFNLYRNYAEHRGWEFSVIHAETADSGGYRKASATVRGFGVYHLMKHESGIHRVQRVPKTESKGRIHTSTIAVAILPQPTEIEVELPQKDLKIDTFRSSGPGGQNANKVESAVRVTHLPTGITAECQQTRSQSENLNIAMDVLRTRLYNIQLEQQITEQTTLRKMQTGCKERSEKIRTYNFPQNRITDHRLGHNYNNIETFMEGGASLDKLIHELLEKSKTETLNQMLEDFQMSKMKGGKQSKEKR